MDTVTVEISSELIVKVLTTGYSVTKKLTVVKGIPSDYRLDAIVFDRTKDVATLHFNHKNDPYGEYTHSRATAIEVIEES